MAQRYRKNYGCGGCNPHRPERPTSTKGYAEGGHTNRPPGRAISSRKRACKRVSK